MFLPSLVPCVFADFWIVINDTWVHHNLPPLGLCYTKKLKGVFDLKQHCADRSARVVDLQSGAELKTEQSSRTLSAHGSDALAVFLYTVTDEVNKMQYLSNTQTFLKRFHEQQKYFLYTV